jgi:hypothetical protein
MFKFIFRVMTVSVFLVFLTIGLAFWKGGEPFKLWGRGLVIIGETISDFGDFVDKFMGNSEEIQEKIKEVVESNR